MTLLNGLARLFAVLAGLVLTGMTLMTCVSLIGRNTTGWTLTGDFELTGAAAGAAIAMFLPWCQIRRGNIIVDFFTTKASETTRRGLDRLGALCLALMMALLTWRSALGGLNAWKSGSGSMMLGFPEWITYAGIVPALALTAVIAFTQALVGFETSGEAAPHEGVAS